MAFWTDKPISAAEQTALNAKTALSVDGTFAATYNIDSTPVTAADVGAVALSTVTTKGDTLVATASSVVARVAVGTNGYGYIADSNQTPGVKWTPPPNTLWAPSSSIDNCYSRLTRIDAQAFLASGALRLVGGVVIPSGRAVNSITFVSVGAAATPTNQWFCLVDQAFNVLVKTADDTTTAWAANAAKTLTLASTYTPTSQTAVYVGCMVAAATVPTLAGVSGNVIMNAITPPMAVSSTASLTNPASLGATCVNSGSISGLPYCYVT